MTSMNRSSDWISPRVWALVAGVCGAVIVLAAPAWSSAPPSSFWFWAAMCLVGEVLWVRLPVGSATISMVSCCHFANLLLFPMPIAMSAIALGGLAGESIFMRKPPVRALFNSAQSALAAAGASWVLGALSPTWVPGTPWPVPSGSAHAMALAIAAACYVAINTGSVSWIVALHERIPFVWAWRANFGSLESNVLAGALISMGALLAGHYAVHGPWGVALVALPLIAAHHAYQRVFRSRMEPEQPVRKAA